LDESFRVIFDDAKQIEIFEQFSKKFRVLVLKRSLLSNLKEASNIAKWRFKLMRNFVRIFDPIIEKKLKTKIRFSFRKIKAIKPKPFHRINKRRKAPTAQQVSTNRPFNSSTHRSTTPLQSNGKDTKRGHKKKNSISHNNRSKRDSKKNLNSHKKLNKNSSQKVGIPKKRQAQHTRVNTTRSKTPKTRFKNSKNPVKKNQKKSTTPLHKSAISQKNGKKGQNLKFKKNNKKKELKLSKSNQLIDKPKKSQILVNHQSTTDFVQTLNTKENEIKYDLFQQTEGILKTVEILAKHAKIPCKNIQEEKDENFQGENLENDDMEIESISTEIRKKIFLKFFFSSAYETIFTSDKNEKFRGKKFD